MSPPPSPAPVSPTSPSPSPIMQPFTPPTPATPPPPFAVTASDLTPPCSVPNGDTVPSLKAQTSDHILQGLCLPSTLEPGTAAYIASAYAAETRNIQDAEAFIAERRYRQQLIGAQSLRLHMLKARSMCQQTSTEVARFQLITNAVITVTDAHSELAEARYADHLYDDADPSELRRFHNISNNTRGVLA